MATPEFILSLREKIGHDLLWLPGVSAVVFDSLLAPRQVLLGERRDNGRWAIPTGILDPGEEPAAGIMREVEEETGVKVRLGALFDVESHGPIIYPNGDQCSYINVSFIAEALSGEARVNDDESTRVAWFPIGELPETLTQRHHRLIVRALSFRAEGADYANTVENGS